MGPPAHMAFAVVAAVLVCWLAGRGPQPLTDGLERLVQPTPDQTTLIVPTDGIDDVDALVAQAEGAADILVIPRSHRLETGFLWDLDGRVRRFQTRDGPMRLVTGGHIPHLPTRNLDSVELSTHRVVFADVKPWTVPMVKTSTGDMPVAVAHAHALAGPSLRTPGSITLLAIGALIGSIGVLGVGSTRRLRWLAVAVPLTCAIGYALGYAVPLEAPLAAAVTSVAFALGLALSRQYGEHLKLIEWSVWRLQARSERPMPVEDAWPQLCRVATDLRVANRAWAIETTEGRRLLGSAPMLEELPENLTGLQSIPLESLCGRTGELLIETLDSQVDLKALRRVAGTICRRSGDSWVEASDAAITSGTKVLRALLDGAGNSRDRTPQATFDPVGLLVDCDPELNGVVSGRRLAEVWAGLGGESEDVAKAIAGHARPVAQGPLGEAVLEAEVDEDSLIGLKLRIKPAKRAAVKLPDDPDGS